MPATPYDTAQAMRRRRPLRVLHVIPAVAPRYGGPSAAVVGMCRGLQAAGTETLIATTDADGRGRLAVALGRSTTFAGVPAIFFRRQASEGFKWSAPLSRWLSRHVAEFDLVHVHAVFSHSSIAAGRACRSARVPYVVRPLGTLDPWSVGRRRLRKRLLFRLGVRDLLSGAARMHYTTAEEGRLAESVVGSLPAGTVVPVGVDDVYFRPNAPPTGDAPYVLALSRLDAKKRLEWIINACHAMASESGLGVWRLVIAGDGEAAYVARLRDLAARGPARDRIVFEGWVDGEAKAALIRGASLFVLPSHQENLGVAMLEALASGVPALVTPGVNLGVEIAAARAGWLTGDREDAVVAGLRAAIGDDAERTARGRRAAAFAERFRWPRVVAELMDLYGEVALLGDGEGTRPGRSSPVECGLAPGI
jgi:glycosyltransferase involved in cell wall biosynthesis